MNRVRLYQKTLCLLCIPGLKPGVQNEKDFLYRKFQRNFLVLTLLALIGGIMGLVRLRPKGKGIKPNKNQNFFDLPKFYIFFNELRKGKRINANFVSRMVSNLSTSEWITMGLFREADKLGLSETKKAFDEASNRLGWTTKFVREDAFKVISFPMKGRISPTFRINSFAEKRNREKKWGIDRMPAE